MNTNDDITLPPDTLLMITDTEKAKHYASAFGLLDPITKASQLPEPAIMITSENHDTHWLVVGLFRGYSKPEDNGMNFMAYPKTMFSLQQVQDWIRSHMGDNRIEFYRDKPKKQGQ